MVRRWRWIVFVIWVLALLYSFVLSPDDAFLKSSERIFYIHFGSAIACFIAFGTSWVGAIFYLIRKDLKYDRLSAAAAEVGTLLATAVLVSGSIWARVAWNTWWTWDPRLITTAVLWFLYIGYFVLRSFLQDDPRRRALYGAVFALFAFLDVPIVFMSVRWWATIHPVLFTGKGMNISSSSMIWAMTLFVVGMAAFFVDLLILRLKQMEVEDRFEALKARMRATV